VLFGENSGDKGNDEVGTNLAVMIYYMQIMLQRKKCVKFEERKQKFNAMNVVDWIENGEGWRENLKSVRNFEPLIHIMAQVLT